MVTIHVAYIKGRSAYMIETPFESVTRVFSCHPDLAVLQALKDTSARDILLITKSKVYELLDYGIQPRDEVQRAISESLSGKKVRFGRISQSNQSHLVAVMESELAKVEEIDEEYLIQASCDSFGYDDLARYGFNRDGLHRNGTYFDDNGYDLNGFNKDGFNSQGYNRGGFDKDGFNKDGLDRLGYGRDGYNQEGFSKLGFDRRGYDKEGYDKDGFDARGLDRNGFDRQGYDLEGNYLAYVDNYIRKNINIVIKNKTLIYSEGVKNLFINIDRARSSFNYGDYIGSLVHLRRGLEELVYLALKYNNISAEDIDGLTSMIG